MFFLSACRLNLYVFALFWFRAQYIIHVHVFIVMIQLDLAIVSDVP